MNDCAVLCGLDVGKSEHHATARAPDGKRLFDANLPQAEARLPDLFEELSPHRPVLVVSDQPNRMGVLPFAVARDAGCEVAYLPGLSTCRIADLHLAHNLSGGYSYFPGS